MSRSPAARALAETGGASGAVLDARLDIGGRDADDAVLRGTGDELTDTDGDDDGDDDGDGTDDDVTDGELEAADS